MVEVEEVLGRIREAVKVTEAAFAERFGGVDRVAGQGASLIEQIGMLSRDLDATLAKIKTLTGEDTNELAAAMLTMLDKLLCLGSIVVLAIRLTPGAEVLMALAFKREPEIEINTIRRSTGEKVEEWKPGDPVPAGIDAPDAGPCFDGGCDEGGES